jgi:hypothetical protein
MSTMANFHEMVFHCSYSFCFFFFIKISFGHPQATGAELRRIVQGRALLTEMVYHAHHGTRQWNEVNARGKGRGNGGGKGRGGKRRGGKGRNLKHPSAGGPAMAAAAAAEAAAQGLKGKGKGKGKAGRARALAPLDPWLDPRHAEPNAHPRAMAAELNGQMFTVWDCAMDGTECESFGALVRGDRHAPVLPFAAAGVAVPRSAPTTPTRPLKTRAGLASLGRTTSDPVMPG